MHQAHEPHVSFNYSLLPKEIASLPTLRLPSKLLLACRGPAQMSLSLSSLPCTLWVRGQGTSLFVTLASLNCGWPFTSVSPAAWRLPVSCITAAQPRAWHVPGEVQEISAGRRLTRRKKQTFAEPLLWARPMPANLGAAEPTLSALEGYLLVPA